MKAEADAPAPCTQRPAQQRLIARHFERRISVAEETVMRAHLPDCASCRRRYERYMLFAELLPSRPHLADRLAVGLGIRAVARTQGAAAKPPETRGKRGWNMLAVGAAACLGLAVVASRRDAGIDADEFMPRGSTVLDERPQIEVYRVAADGSSGRPSDWMAPADELAFAYRNPAGFTRLMVLGIDDAHEIYWFHPAWSDPRENPRAVSIRSGTGPFELPEAIAHDIRGSRLKIVALFTNEDLSVRNVEQAFNSGSPDPEGAVRAETVLEVRR